MSNIAQTIGQRIRNYRTQADLSQEKLAELSSCHATYIGQLERGEKNATLESVEKIALALHVPLSQLFEKLGTDSNREAEYPLLCYELVTSRSIAEQQRLYNILTEITKLKDS